MTVPEKPIKSAFFIICMIGLAYVVTTVANIAGYVSDQITDSIKLGLIIVLCMIGFLSGRAFFRFTRTTTIFLAAMSFLIVYHITELTEEFMVFQSIPLFGEMTLVKRAFETTLMIGSICLLLGGIYFSVFEINKAKKQLDADVALLKSLASQLSITEERERHRLATHLHDHIGQSLVFSKLKLDELHHSATSSELTKSLDEICNNIDQIIQDTRTLTFDLSSPILNEIGFETAVTSWLDEQIHEKYGINTEFEDDGQPKPLDDDIRAILFRNVRELLTNVVKHAKAENVKVSICRDDEDIRVRVEDDGIGFDPVEIKSRSMINHKFGLFSIRERLEQLGGRVEIGSKPGGGSRIMMTAPLKREEVTDPSLS
ncbi:MAG: sensor histidine kinase [Planctomycetes bacterium]|nr:sensor histidine kinase [Planctomycetota bacterium]